MVREQVLIGIEVALAVFFEHPKPTFVANRFSAKTISLDTSLSVPCGGKVTNIMAMKLYVGNISFNTSSNDLQSMFAAYGPVLSASVIEDRETGRSRGFGFVEMESTSDGATAIEQLNGKEVDGRSLKVNEAKPRDNAGGGGGRGSNRGGKSGYGGGYGGSSW